MSKTFVPTASEMVMEAFPPGRLHPCEQLHRRLPVYQLLFNALMIALLLIVISQILGVV